MAAESQPTTIPVDDFCRRFSLRAANLMWFLGAGASAAAGIPTAYDMTWDFKRRLYASQRHVSANTVWDLSNQAIRARIQAHIDSLGTLPSVNSKDEYAALFEAVFPSESDRQAYIESQIAGAKPSYGHFAIATLMRAKLGNIVWTTNFDALLADACAKVFEGTSALTSSSLDAPHLAVQRVNESKWPVEIKFHGDFRSRRLKNTNDELRSQDARLRRLFVDCCRRFGVVVAGYSGRDDSIIDSFAEALKVENTFPNGMFWLHRDGDALRPSVAELIAQANAIGVEAALVCIQNFDEVTRDAIRLIDGIDTRILDDFALTRKRRSEAPKPSGRIGWPVLRLNAVPIEHAPTQCRKVVCKIGGYKEVEAAVASANVDIIAARVKAGVLAFGSDGDVRAALEKHDITEFDLYSIEVRRLRYDSGERGLLRKALSRGLSRTLGLDMSRRRATDLFAPRLPSADVWKPLANIVGVLVGKVQGHPELKWREGFGTRIDWADDRLWLLIEPRIVFDGLTQDNRSAASDFARERTVRRYNRTLNELVAFWANVLTSNRDEIRAFGTSDGVDAVFVLGAQTAFSRRVGA